MIRVIYKSRAVDSLSTQDLGEISESARANNVRKITGMLIYNKGYFMQLLDGEQKYVDNAIKRIESSTRHYDMEILKKEKVDFALFPQWSMGVDAPEDMIRNAVRPVMFALPDIEAIKDGDMAELRFKIYHTNV